MKPRDYIFLAAITSLFVIFCFVNVRDSSVQNSVSIENRKTEALLENQLNSTFPITFYHKAYVDYRYTPPRLRIFSLNACITKTNFLLADLFHEGVVEPTRVKLFGDSLEGECPSTYGPAKPCVYVAHSFTVDLLAPGGMNKVLIHLGERKVNLKVNEIAKRFESGLTMCLQPVYYYSQWQNIVLYVEAWRAQGATRFIVFCHSATKETRKVLDYYRNMGIIEIRSWPSFGSLPSAIEKRYPRVDDSVFIFSYFLAMNICILDIKTTVGTIADFDEVMVPSNGSLLEYALHEMTGTNVGALKFPSNYVTMNPSIYSNNFSGVAEPLFVDKGGPPKYIFNASVIELAQVHWVRSFIEPKVTKNANGALLHLRYNVAKNGETVKRKFRFFPDHSEEHIQNMQKTALGIFNGSMPEFSPNLIEGVNSCVKKISKKKNTCRSTGGMCKEEMDKLYEWVYDESEGIFVS